MNITLVVSSIATCITLLGAGVHWHEQQADDCGGESEHHSVVKIGPSDGSPWLTAHGEGHWSNGSACPSDEPDSP